METFNLSTNIGNKIIKFRKWKVKDKNKFINSDDNVCTKEALVYDCLEDKKVALSEEEYKFMLMKIREASLKDKIQFDFTCSSCGTEFEYIANLDEIMKPVFKEYGAITAGDIEIVMCHLRNRDFYEKAIKDAENHEERLIADFILHIESFNGSDGFTFAELNEKLNDLDVDVFEEIFKTWEQTKFKVDNLHPVGCPTCNKTEMYEFDDLPGFFPESWNI